MSENYKVDLKNTQRGFSLIEIMVAMIIFLIVISSVYGLMQIGLIDRNRASRRSDVLKNARAALHLIGRDALNAGLGYNRSGALVPDNFMADRLGTKPDNDNERDTLTAVYGGSNLFSNILMPNPEEKTDTVAFAFRDTAFNNGDLISLTNSAATSGNPASVTITTAANGAVQAKSFDLYLIESQSSQVAAMLTSKPNNTTDKLQFAPGDPLRINQPLNGSGDNRSPLKKCASVGEEDCLTFAATAAKRFFWVAYKVKADGTLLRTIYGNNSDKLASEQIQEMPIAYNIQDFQVKYVLEDGRVTDNPAAGLNGILNDGDDRPSDFNLVRQINITIKVQSTENDEQTGKPETVTLNSTFSTRNLKYDAG